MEQLTGFLSAHPYYAMLLTALWSAVSVDLFAFFKAGGWSEATSGFSFKVASYRWAQGVFGAMVGNGVLVGGATAVALLMLWAL